MSKIQKSEEQLIEDVLKLINEAKKTVAVTANSATTILYWSIGNRVNKEVLNNKRADYGKNIVGLLSKKLTGSLWERLE